MEWFGFKDENEYITWFRNLKSGDKFATNGDRFGAPYIIQTVEKVTPKGWVKTKNLTFVDGISRGEEYKRARLITKEIKEKIHEYELRDYFRYGFPRDIKALSYKQLVELDDFFGNFMIEFKEDDKK